MASRESGWGSRLKQARRLPLLLLLFVPAVLIGLQQPPPAARGVRIVDITAAVPEAGGFQPDSVTVYAGQRVQLRFRSADTTHGVAIGPGLGFDLGDLAPGEVKVVNVTFPEAGTYTFYCNKWCSPNHWRMRGVIAVEDPRASSHVAEHDPVIDNLAAEGVDIDAYLADSSGTAHGDAAHDTSAQTGATLPARPLQGAAQSAPAGATRVGGLSIPAELEDAIWRQRHTPREAEALLTRANPQVDP